LIRDARTHEYKKKEEVLAPNCLSHKEHQPLAPQSHEITLTNKGIFITFQYRHIPNDFITIDVDSINPKDEHTQKRVKDLFYRMLPGFRNIVAFWKVPRL
jgi:hypothetical protein